jgi:hypothetical protein
VFVGGEEALGIAECGLSIADLTAPIEDCMQSCSLAVADSPRPKGSLRRRVFEMIQEAAE